MNDWERLTRKRIDVRRELGRAVGLARRLDIELDQARADLQDALCERDCYAAALVAIAATGRQPQDADSVA